MATMYRNWTQICKITNRLLKMALSTINLATEEGKKLVAAFPECFRNTPELGPVPMSVILEMEQQNSLEGGEQNWELGKFLVSHDAIPLGIPKVEYAFDQGAANDWGIPVLPEYIKPEETSVGDVVELLGGKFVVVEINDNPGVNTMWFVPAVCILLDVQVGSIQGGKDSD